MFGWFLRRWRRRRFNKRRQLFQYFDGKFEKSIDPLATVFSIEADPEFVSSRHPALAGAGNKDAYDICQRMICRVFKVQPYDSKTGYGLTETERMDLFVDFDQWLATQKKSIGPTLNSPVSTEASTSTTSTEETTSGTSDSTSTETESPSKPQSESV